MSEELREALLKQFEPDDALAWLFAGHQMLGGAEPARAVLAGDEDAVLRLLDQLASGAYI